MRLTAKQIDRFWSKVDKNGPIPAHRPGLGPCWIWTAATSQGGGYGQVGFDGKVYGAHRVAWQLFRGEDLEPGIQLDHLCHEPRCVHPDHLSPVTPRQHRARTRLGKASPSGRYGSGSIKEVAPGKWHLRIYLGRDPVSGAPRQRQITFRGSERAANRELALLTAQAAEAKVVESTVTVGQLLDRWLEQIEQTRRPTTLAGYRKKIEHRIRPALGDIRAAELTGAHLDRFYQASLADGLSTTTVHQLHAILAAALHQAERWGWIERNPARQASPPPARRTDLKVPTPAELRDLVAACHDSDPVLACAIALAALTGCRRGELVALRWSDVDLEAGQVTIARSLTVVDGERHEGPTKTHQSRRIALDELALEVVRYRIGEQRALSDRAGSPLVDDPYLLTLEASAGQPISPDTLTHRFSRLCDGRFRFHDLRHFSVTTLVAAGVDIRTVAERHGHAQATMTLNRYAHALPERDRDAAAVLGQALTSAPAIPPPSSR